MDVEKYKQGKRLVESYENGEWNPQSEIDQTALQKAYDLYELEKIYFDGNYEEPQILPKVYQIDPKDGIVKRDASNNTSPIYIIRHPAPILKDQILAEWFNICKFAYKGLYPVSGGYEEQTTEFTEYFNIYLRWKELREERKTNEITNPDIS